MVRHTSSNLGLRLGDFVKKTLRLLALLRYNPACLVVLKIRVSQVRFPLRPPVLISLAFMEAYSFDAHCIQNVAIKF